MNKHATDKPSMRDVARRCGFTAMTVSRFFSGSAQVSAETREHIIDAATVLGFCCASCNKIDVLPIAIIVSGETNYLCSLKCSRQFINTVKL